MAYLKRDNSDPMTAAEPRIPSKLELWEEVTRTGRFFDPYVRGFTYVEVYNPEYWMERNFARKQPCFHPIFRMRTRSALSPLNAQTTAIWVSKYDDIVPEVESGIARAARSFHCGFPLWFFKRSQVDSLVTVIFDEWGILGE
jgi:hypothetical protein